MNELTINAYAKINLSLNVLSRRPDGYHEVRMIMQSIGLHDVLTFSTAAAPGIHIQSNRQELPNDDGNLIYRAAKLFFETANLPAKIAIQLTKNIPIAAGMAGGSTDAAATLHALNQLFQTGYPLDTLKALGVKLGADVPYCLQLGTALSEGIGEKLTALSPAPGCFCLIVKPPVGVSTKYVYEHLSLTDASHPDIDAQLSAIREGSYSGLCSTLGNILESVSVPLYPEIEAIKKKMLAYGADGALMSGSGPTVFGLFSKESAAKAAYEEFMAGEYQAATFLTTFYQP